MTTTYGTLSSIVGIPVEVRLVRRGISSPAEGGFVTSRQLQTSVSRQSGQAQTRVWGVTFGPTSFNSLLTSWLLAKGAALPLSWTPPPPDDGGGAVPVRFVNGTLRVRKGPGAVFEASAELEEVL